MTDDPELTPAQRIDILRRVVIVDLARLNQAIVDACPGPHEPRQHRDRKPPWCASCRYTPMGELIPTDR